MGTSLICVCTYNCQHNHKGKFYINARRTRRFNLWETCVVAKWAYLQWVEQDENTVCRGPFAQLHWIVSHKKMADGSTLLLVSLTMQVPRIWVPSHSSVWCSCCLSCGQGEQGPAPIPPLVQGDRWSGQQLHWRTFIWGTFCWCAHETWLGLGQ